MPAKLTGVRVKPVANFGFQLFLGTKVISVAKRRDAIRDAILHSVEMVRKEQAKVYCKIIAGKPFFPFSMMTSV